MVFWLFFYSKKVASKTGMGYLFKEGGGKWKQKKDVE